MPPPAYYLACLLALALVALVVAFDPKRPRW